ncbi:hypothetical protein A0H81_14178 [Grifola frondosa]|uniref:Uncharacterized protein n=1 Tax=Grifola frondosa TaxID=5627 RepID=A0A1C7LMU6_GRIFR|nr:hypothetical protein A0H81_14178 [Grifola frondosa]
MAKNKMPFRCAQSPRLANRGNTVSRALSLNRTIPPFETPHARAPGGLPPYPTLRNMVTPSHSPGDMMRNH